MDNKQLLENMSRLGYPLLDTLQDFDPNETLAQVVKSDDRRYWDGFPVLLANVIKEGAFTRGKVVEYLDTEPEKQRFKDLFLLSLALYEFTKFRFQWVKDLVAALSSSERVKVRQYKEALTKNSSIKAGSDLLDPQRLRNAFQNYSSLQVSEVRDFNKRHDELSLEFAFSQVFSLKQKELFNKKLKGEMLTKTDKEYFSRVVRKKVVALANSELHQLARKVLEL